MSRIPSVLRVATRVLFFAGALLWAGVAAVVATGVIPIGDVPRSVSLGLAVAMVIGAGTMTFLGWRCLRGRRWIDTIAVLVALGNVVLTFADQVGPFDLAYLAFAVILLVVLIGALLGANKRIDHAAMG